MLLILADQGVDIPAVLDVGANGKFINIKYSYQDMAGKYAKVSSQHPLLPSKLSCMCLCFIPESISGIRTLAPMQSTCFVFKVNRNM